MEQTQFCSAPFTNAGMNHATVRQQNLSLFLQQINDNYLPDTRTVITLQDQGRRGGRPGGVYAVPDRYTLKYGC